MAEETDKFAGLFGPRKPKGEAPPAPPPPAEAPATNEEEDQFAGLFGQGTKKAPKVVGKRRADDKRVLGALLRAITSKRDLSREDQDTVMQITMEKVLDAVGAQKITIFLIEDDDRVHFAYSATARSLTAGNPELEKKFAEERERIKSMSLPKGQGIVGRVIATAKPYILMDAQSDANFYAGIDKDTGFQTKSMITVPLITDKVIGAIQVLNKDAAGVPFFTKADMALLEDVAGYSAKVIQKVAHPEVQFTEDEKATYVARLTGHEFYAVTDDWKPDEKLVQLVGKEAIEKTHIIPIDKSSSAGIKAGMTNPLDLPKKEQFQVLTKLTLDEVVVVTEKAVQQVLAIWKKPASAGVDDALLAQFETKKEAEEIDVEGDATEESAPIVQLANRIIEDAYVRGASDIHIEPQEEETLIRYRVDGSLEEKLRIPKTAQNALIARLKIMSELDISERRLPQDGRIIFKKHNKKFDVDLRVSTGPMNHGEKVVMRILDKTKSALPLDKLGYSPGNLVKYREIIRAPYGMILHCGPTGSGKSMTLYSALGEVNTPDMNIQTAEDPIEYTLKGINQMQMKKDIGLTFQAALRCFLRQDPDIILVGEIRDTETAEIAIEAALTGHLLFSTLHTNDACSTPARLIEMEVEPFMVSASVLCVCAQRLLRRVCSKCKVAYEPSPEERALLYKAPEGKISLFRNNPKGCDKCGGSGYKGRVGVHELLAPNDEVKGLINKRAPTMQIKEAAMRGGMVSLYQDGMLKVLDGITTVEEVLANIRKD